MGHRKNISFQLSTKVTKRWKLLNERTTAARQGAKDARDVLQIANHAFARWTHARRSARNARTVPSRNWVAIHASAPSVPSWGALATAATKTAASPPARDAKTALLAASLASAQ